MQNHILAFDIGGTTIKAARTTRTGSIVKKTEVPTNAHQGKKKFLETLEEVAQSLWTPSIHAIGIGSPGPLDLRKGILLHTGNLPLKNFSFRAFFQKKFRRPVFLNNDARAFTLAEALKGAGKKYRSVVGLTLGTGVGGGIVINKQLYSGRSNAGELGHITLDMNGPKGNAGDRGSLEEYISAKGMRAMLLREGVATPQELEARGRSGMLSARIAWQDYGVFLGAGLASIIHALDPDIVILGGKIAHAFPLFKKTMRATVNERCIFTPPPIVTATLGDNAGLIGAALLTNEINKTKKR